MRTSPGARDAKRARSSTSRNTASSASMLPWMSASSASMAALHDVHDVQDVHGTHGAHCVAHPRDHFADERHRIGPTQVLVDVGGGELAQPLLGGELAGAAVLEERLHVAARHPHELV